MAFCIARTGAESIISYVYYVLHESICVIMIVTDAKCQAMIDFSLLMEIFPQSDLAWSVCLCIDRPCSF